mmetsp:Transcript_28479/g.42246  ORF Transcript_28479/g.42246 Transcript_28479/m.42246 type:complete len:446 (+) Transcript_28479:86-1423(+)
MSTALSESENQSFITAMGTIVSNEEDHNDENEHFKTPSKQHDGNDFKFSLLQSDPIGIVGHTALPMDVIGASNSHEMMVSPLAEREADSVRTYNQHTIDLNLRLDQPANFAFVYIKPNANTPAVRDLVHDFLLDHINPLDDGGGRIVAEYDISSDLIQEGNLVEKQFKLLAHHAMFRSGSSVDISNDDFKAAFGEDLQLVKNEKRIYNAREALSGLACNPRGLEQAWREAEKDSSKGKIHCFGPDCYCGNLELNGDNVYVMNGFFMTMREEYVEAGASTHAYVIQWNADTLSWKDFINKAIGAADPFKALPDSLRKIIFEKYQMLGMSTQPSLANDCIHASASPLEGLAERIHWCSKKVHQDEYGRILLGKGIPEGKILDWCDNVFVSLLPLNGKDPNSCDMRIFDVVQGMDSKECADKLTELYDIELFGPTGQKGTCKDCCVLS